MQRAERFSGRAGTLLALLGVAIGLGNVWRFPYMMGAHGGSAFLLLYVALTVAFAIPLLAVEWALGRQSRQGPIATYRAALGPRLGSTLGCVLAASILIANSYYMVVTGNIVYTTLFGIGLGFGGAHLTDYHAGLEHGHLQYAFALAVLGAGAWVQIRGVNRGIEAASRWMVPLFGAVVLYLVGYALSLAGAAERFAAFLRPDFAALGIRDVFAALGQAFFSLSVGGTFMVVYGNYLRDDQALPGLAVNTALGDAGSALLAALFIVPTVLYFSLPMDSGPNLIFDTLPKLFALMSGGRVVGNLFLFALVLMAFLSAVAALEVCVSALLDVAGTWLTRTAAVAIVAALEVVLMWPSAHTPSIIATLDLIFGSGMQIFGALVAVIALTWGLGRAVALAQIAPGRNDIRAAALFWWLRWVVPGVLFAILALTVADAFTSR